MSAAASPQRTAPRALWRIAEAFLQTFFALFGPPERIAAQHTLTHRPRTLLLTWLRAGETLMRRLLLIEASAIVAPNTPPSPRAARKRERKLMGFTAEHPEKWRVSFRCFLDRRRPRRHAPKLAGEDAGGPSERISREDRWSYENFPPVRFCSAWPLAERAEALLRVFNNPAPYANRLARRLHATPKRALEVLRHNEPDRDLIGRESFDQVRAASYAALERRDSS